MWCSSNRLWASSLQPPLKGKELSDVPLGERISAVESVVADRSKLLKNSTKKLTHYHSALNAGRILVFNPLRSLVCGGSEANSEGFFNMNDTPPWDTWLMYIDERNAKGVNDQWSTYLLSWVPHSYIDLADDGIETNPAGCIDWASFVPARFVSELEEHGIGARVISRRWESPQ